MSKYIIQKFQGYKMEQLISEILKAKGFTVYHSKQGADGGKDILAAGGVMNKVGAEYGILVSWSGFK